MAADSTAMRVIGAGVGRTGTYSLKLAINELGFGPCHHMEAVRQNMAVQVPLWTAALNGSADWPAIYDGYSSAVDWPTARFFRELSDAYRDAKFVLTERRPENWADSFAATIRKFVDDRASAPAEMHGWLEMVETLISATGFPTGLSRDELIEAFMAHNAAVKATISAERLLVFAVRDGWGPLCEFLRVPMPDEPFPRTNNREEFWDLVSQEI